MAASPPQPTTCSGPAIAPRPRAISAATSPASAASPPGPPTPGSASSSSGCAPALAIKPGPLAPRPTPLNTSVGPANTMNMGSAISPSPGTPGTQLSMTSKEWVIPPRPKPGRKPATDDPPTKRKAQNRAAQRAFRERRAAKVSELAEELTEVKDEHKKRELELEERIRHLEVETETLRSRCQWLQSTLEKERLDRMRHDIRGAPASSPQEQGFGGMMPDQTPLQRQGASQPVAPRPVAQPFSISHIISPPEESPVPVDLACGACGPNDACICASAVMAEEPVGCGKCTLETRCACLEALQAETDPVPDFKRSGSPSSTFASQPNEKRQRLDADSSTPTTPMEVDFTAMFSRQRKRSMNITEDETVSQSTPPYHQPEPQPGPHDTPHLSVEVKDPCGFCSDGGYCACAEAPTMPTPVTSSLTSGSLTATAMAPVAVQQHQTHTPPPSDDDVVPRRNNSLSYLAPMEVTATGAIKLPPFKRQPRPAPTAATTSTCGPGGPGTCAQCIADPVSGLFCRSLAANLQRNNPSSSGDGCCGGSGGGGGCCKTQTQTQPQPAAQQSQQQSQRPGEGAGGQQSLGLSLSCADAYKTLANHRHFDEAAGQIGEWLPRLKALPVPRMSGGGWQRPGPIEVEAASIMSVLRGFDVRFGRGE